MEPYPGPDTGLLPGSFVPEAGRDSASFPPMTMAPNPATLDFKANRVLPQPVPAWGPGRPLSQPCTQDPAYHLNQSVEGRVWIFLQLEKGLKIPSGQPVLLPQAHQCFLASHQTLVVLELASETQGWLRCGPSP